MSSSHVYYINGQQVMPEATIDIGGITDAVVVRLVKMKMGEPQMEITEEKRSIGHGTIERGMQFGAVDFPWTIQLEVNQVGPTATMGDNNLQWEHVRDDAIDWLDRLLTLEGDRCTLTVERYSAVEDATISRSISVRPKTISGWDWEGDWGSAQPGLYGGCDGARGFNAAIGWHSTFPWWRDTEFTVVDLGAVDSGGASANVDNDGVVACGTQFGFTQAVPAITDVNLSIGGGAALVNLSASFTDLAGAIGSESVLDCEMTDPYTPQIYVRTNGFAGIPGDTVIRDRLVQGSDKLMLPVGSSPNNAIVSASVVGGVANVKFRYRRYWRNP